VGEVVTIAWPVLREGLWKFPCAFAQTELLRVFYHLRDGKLYLPGTGLVPDVKIPLCPLEQVGILGPDPRDVYDGFDFEGTEETSFPAFWGHKGLATMA